MFKYPNESQLKVVKDIMNKFPELIDINKETPDADPFMIALTLQKDIHKNSGYD